MAAAPGSRLSSNAISACRRKLGSSMAAAKTSTTIGFPSGTGPLPPPVAAKPAESENRPGTARRVARRRRQAASRASTLLCRSHDEVQILFNGVCCAASSKCCQQATAQGGIRFLGNEVRDVRRTSLVADHLDQRRLRAQASYLAVAASSPRCRRAGHEDACCWNAVKTCCRHRSAARAR